ncbi:MAG: riboflavin synthase [Leptolyngbya sp. SIO4C1]|nr:riboflavin synthase [Leptolyngbya sp. SIO4C1]
MFTGLIQALGKLHHLSQDRLQITCLEDRDAILADIALGDSIAVDGVCLTVEALRSHGFIASASPETRDRSTLGQLPDNAIVNLEPSLRVGSKIGGHFVTGHVDGSGWLEAAEKTANAWELSFVVETPVAARYIVPKGSIAVNGISLTVAECNAAGSWFKVAIIPVTYDETNLHALRPRDRVNLEGDVLGKYVEKFAQLPAQSAQPETALSLGFLSEHGYL